MKALLSLLFIFTILSSCEKINFDNDFEKSQKAWTNFKSNSLDTYQYTVVGGSWIGSGWETKLTVIEGVVTERYYKYTPPADSEQAIIEWTESESELNTHESSAAAETITLDQVYQKAEQEWLIKRDDAQTLFEVSDDGLIFQAGYVPNNCADDCFVGITIRNIQEVGVPGIKVIN